MLESFVGGGTLTFKWAPSPIIVAADYERAADYLENMMPPLMASRQLAIADVAENFAGEHDPDGNPWARWSESYVESGQPGPSILNQTGDLEGSATDPRAWPITAREMFFSFGALPEYGIWHQQGASRQSAGKGVTRESNLQAIASGVGLDSDWGDNTLPARPFAGISDETQFKILDVFDSWFSGAMNFAIGKSGTVQTRTAGGRFGPKLGA